MRSRGAAGAKRGGHVRAGSGRERECGHDPDLLEGRPLLSSTTSPPAALAAGAEGQAAAVSEEKDSGETEAEGRAAVRASQSHARQRLRRIHNRRPAKQCTLEAPLPLGPRSVRRLVNLSQRGKGRERERERERGREGERRWLPFSPPFRVLAAGTHVSAGDDGIREARRHGIVLVGGGVCHCAKEREREVGQ